MGGLWRKKRTKFLPGVGTEGFPRLQETMANWGFSLSVQHSRNAARPPLIPPQATRNPFNPLYGPASAAPVPTVRSQFAHKQRLSKRTRFS